MIKELYHWLPEEERQAQLDKMRGWKVFKVKACNAPKIAYFKSPLWVVAGQNPEYVIKATNDSRMAFWAIQSMIEQALDFEIVIL